MGDRSGRALAFRMAAVVLAFACGAALAQVADPMRPATAPAEPALPGGSVAVPGSEGSGVQAIFLRRSGSRKSAALINGEYVEQGGQLGERRVVRITENEVILQGPEGREVLTFMFGTEKTPAAAERPMTGTTGK